MIRVLVADDHPLIRSGLSHVLATQPDFLVCGEAENSSETLRLIREQAWDVVILDISMPGKSGLEVLPEIRKWRPNLPVLVLSMYADPHLATRALLAGANGYLTKDDASGELVHAVRCLISGKKYISATIADGIAGIAGKRGKRPHEDLSVRELQVMSRIARGETVSTVARDIGLSVKTVSTYRSRALEKMGMRTNSEFTRYAMQNRLID